MSEGTVMAINAPRHWKEGDIYFAENDWVKMAYVITDDPAKWGTIGWHMHGDSEICVEYVQDVNWRIST